MSNPDPPATAPLPLLGKRLREGDPDALAALFEREASTVYHLALGYLRSEAEAEDVVQGVFTRAWERHAELRDPDRVRGWLFSIARNLIRDQLRTPSTDSVDDHYALPAPGPAPEQEAAATEERDLVWTAAQSLEPRQALILDMAVRQQLTSSEIGEALGYRPGHAAVLLNRAKEALGGAVTALLVARRVDRCERLAALVPQGVRTLSPSERRTVDHHMRRCEICQQNARLLTSPVELFSLIPLAVLGTEAMQRIRQATTQSLGSIHLTAAHAPEPHPGGIPGTHGPASAASRTPKHWGMRPRHLWSGGPSLAPMAGMAIAAVVIAVATPITLLHTLGGGATTTLAPSPTAAASGLPSSPSSAASPAVHWEALSTNPFPISPPSPPGVGDRYTFGGLNDGLAFTGLSASGPGTGPFDTYRYSGTTWVDTGQQLPDGFGYQTSLFGEGSGQYLAVDLFTINGASSFSQSYGNLASWNGSSWSVLAHGSFSLGAGDGGANPNPCGVSALSPGDQAMSFDPNTHTLVVIMSCDDVQTWSAATGWRDLGPFSMDCEESAAGGYLLTAVLDPVSDVSLFIVATDNNNGADSNPVLCTWSGASVRSVVLPAALLQQLAAGENHFTTVITGTFDPKLGEILFLIQAGASDMVTLWAWNGQNLVQVAAPPPASFYMNLPFLYDLEYDSDLGTVVAVVSAGGAGSGLSSAWAIEGIPTS